MNRHSERFSIVWYVCSEYERADEPDRQLLEDMGFKWPTAGLLQMTIREEMMEYGVDQNTINYNSLLSKSKEPRRNGAMQTFTSYDVLPTSHGRVAGRILWRSKIWFWLI